MRSVIAPWSNDLIGRASVVLDSKNKRMMQLYFDKDNMEIIEFGGKKNEIAIEKCENIAKTSSY